MLPDNTSIKQDLPIIDDNIEQLFPLAHTDYSLGINIGGITCRINLPTAYLYESLCERYDQFLSTTDNPDIEIQVQTVEDFNREKYTAVTFDFQENNHYGFRWDFYCRLTLDEKCTAYQFIPPKGHFFSVDSLVRISYSFVAAAKGGLLVHGAGIVDKGKGCLFAGKSESGKTTLSKISMPTKEVLTDEISLIVRDRDTGDFFLHGTPFWGEMGHGVNNKAKLNNIFFLNKSQKVFLEKIAGHLKYSQLLKNILLFAKDPLLSKTIFNTVGLLADRLSFYELHFMPDDSFWRCIDDNLE